ncbi:MAG TPA: sigma-70 family RNA polymerase sigma factor [Planctomycetota bacterium]|jgi:RNA polymerase sigma-70 factor (ECF subfamily)|nr:sigma-70 family RNA polymerase sigma factor [Planctomycetota bacterium]
MDERQLIDRCIRGEAGAWELLVREYGPSVHDAARFTLRRVLGSAQDEDIENVYQGVLLGLCDRDAHRLKLFQSRSSFRTWVTSVTVRFSLNYIRTEKRKGSLKYLGLDAAASELPDRDLMPDDAEERERLHRALEKIPSREKLILKLFYFDGLSYKSIAEVLRIPVNSVSPLLIRAKDSLRKHAEIS